MTDTVTVDIITGDSDEIEFSVELDRQTWEFIESQAASEGISMDEAFNRAVHAGLSLLERKNDAEV